MRREVVVTGVGAITPLGLSAQMTWERMCNGEVATRPVTAFDATIHPTNRAGEVQGFDPLDYLSVVRSNSVLRATQFAVAAAKQAAADAGIDYFSFEGCRERVGVAMGSVLGDRPGLEPHLLRAHAGSCAEYDLEPFEIANVAEGPAIELGFEGPCCVLPTACAAGNCAIALAAHWIATGVVDLAIAGGSDELSPSMYMMFSLFRSLAPDVVQPFDRHRRGLMLSEGSGALVLESRDSARARGVRIYGVVAGSGNCADAYDMTHPHPTGDGAVLAMDIALKEAGLGVSDVNYISAHGTGTPANDRIEAQAVRRLFGCHADGIGVSSVKSMIGHAQGAASAIEAITCLFAIRDGLVPPTMNHREFDPECPIDVVPNRARKTRLDAVLNNGFGFGGNICCLALTRA